METEGPSERLPGDDFPLSAACFHGNWLPLRALVTSREGETPEKKAQAPLLLLPSQGS